MVTDASYVSRRRVLVVEDNELNRAILGEILAEDYTVIEAVDGVDGMEKLREHFRDLSLVLLDVQMPRMNGFEFLEEKGKDAMLAPIPVIVTTGSTITEDEERCLALGATDFVTKPYAPKIILRRMEAVIRLTESIATLREVEYDALTGLFTKGAAEHHARLRFRKTPDVDYDLVLLNIEDFAYLNERYGRAVCDDFLRHVGTVLRPLGDRGILCTRYHGDRFLLLDTHAGEAPEHLIETIDRELHENSPIRDFTLRAAVYPCIDKETPFTLLVDRLSLAIGSIKHQYHAHIAYYDDAMSQKLLRARLLEECMEKSLADGQFHVYYQAKHDPMSGKAIGAEALIRWIHPEYGFLSPGEFIPLFEENGFITTLDRFVFETVCRDVARWKVEGLPLVPISINASRRDFLDPGFKDFLTAAPAACGVEKEWLHLEVTESIALANEHLYEEIRAVHDLGFIIELDDFGSGYSSLGSLSDFPMDIIKLDMSFSRRLDKQKEVVRMIISLAHALEKLTVAEGVETLDQVEILRRLGCDCIQGYFYAKPLPVHDFEEHLCRVNLQKEEVTQ